MRLAVLALIASLTATTNALAGQGYTCTSSQTDPAAPVILVTVVPGSSPMVAERVGLAGSIRAINGAPTGPGADKLLPVARDGHPDTDAGAYWLTDTTAHTTTTAGTPRR